jgi:predicted RNA methylase
VSSSSSSAGTDEKPPSSVANFPWLKAAADHFARGTLRLENALYEHRLGIITHGLHNWKSGDRSEDEHLYYFATSYRRVFRILDALHLGPSDTFVDLGCGKGRVTCCASLYPVSEVIGIEDIQELCTAAEKNLRILRGDRAPTKILHCKAEEFEYIKGTVIYMFHPFGPRTLTAVLSRLDTGLRLNPRKVRIVYVNPVHEYVLKETNWLELYEHWPCPRGLWTRVVHPVSFWRLRHMPDSIAARAPIAR